MREHAANTTQAIKLQPSISSAIADAMLGLGGLVLHGGDGNGGSESRLTDCNPKTRSKENNNKKQKTKINITD